MIAKAPLDRLITLKRVGGMCSGTAPPGLRRNCGVWFLTTVTTLRSQHKIAAPSRVLTRRRLTGRQHEVSLTDSRMGRGHATDSEWYGSCEDDPSFAVEDLHHDLQGWLVRRVKLESMIRWRPRSSNKLVFRMCSGSASRDLRRNYGAGSVSLPDHYFLTTRMPTPGACAQCVDGQPSTGSVL